MEQAQAVKFKKTKRQIVLTPAAEKILMQTKDKAVKAAAYSICKSIYRAERCSCERSDDMFTCSTMVLAAQGVVDVVLKVVNDG